MSYLTLEAIVKSVWEVPHVRAQMTERCAPWGIDEAGTVHHPMQGSLPKAHWREEGFCYLRRVDADGARYVRVDLKATALNQRQTSARDSRHRQRDTPVTELLLTPDGGWSEGIVARDARADEDVVIPLFIDITQVSLSFVVHARSSQAHPDALLHTGRCTCETDVRVCFLPLHDSLSGGLESVHRPFGYHAGRAGHFLAHKKTLCRAWPHHLPL